MTRIRVTVLAGVVLLGAAACGDGDGAGAADDLFVTMQDATGDQTVFRLGNDLAAGCGGRLNALIEPGCPRLSMAFYVHGPDASHPLELYVQGAYGFVMRS